MASKHGILDEGEKAALAAVLRRYPCVVSAYQFGSTMRGTAGASSDLDIALLLDEETAPVGASRLRFEALLSHDIHRSLEGMTSDVDVASLNGRSISFQHTVLRTGVVIYDANPQARRHHEWRVIIMYLDMEPTLRWIGRFQPSGWLRRCGVR